MHKQRMLVLQNSVLMFLFAFISLVFIPKNNAFAKRLLPIDVDPSGGTGLSISVVAESDIAVDAGPLQAQVWVESQDGRLIARGLTDESGKYNVDLSAAEVSSGLMVTAWAKGYSAVSHVHTITSRINFVLPSIPRDEYSELRGTIKGFGDLDSDTRATAGLVAKTLQVADLGSIDTSAFISPMHDEVDIFGPRNIPSNLVLPDQTIPVFFLPIRINKPIYRLPMLAGSTNRYFGLSGSVPVSEAVEAIRGGNTWDLINLMKIEKVGITEPILAPSQGEVLSREVVINQKVSEKINLKVEKGYRAPKGIRRLVGTLWEAVTGVFIPTDMKQVEETSLQLTAVNARKAKIIDIYTQEDGDRFRGEWIANGTKVLPSGALTARVEVNGNALEQPWQVGGVDSANWMVGRVESKVSRSVGGERYVDRWLIVGPRNSRLRVPPLAALDIGKELGQISHISVDLMQFAIQSYPFVNESENASSIQSLEKVRKKL